MSQLKRSRAERSSSHPAITRNLRPFSQAGVGNGLAYLLLIVFTLTAYANAWPDTLTFDDLVFVDSSRFSGLGLADMLRFFTEDLWAASGADSKMYRPLLLVSIASEVQVFGEWMAGYHLVNIGLHVLATTLVYAFLRQLLRAGGNTPGEARQFALLAALIFGVHPIHTEVVNSIFNRSEILVTIGVVGGLSWFLRCLDTQPKKAWLGLSLIYLLVLFCRESGAALPLLAVAMIWLTHSGSWQRRLRTCAPVVLLLVPLGIYLALRAHALGATGTAEVSGLQPGQAVQLAPLAHFGMAYGPERLLPAIAVWFEALKILLWPHPLQIYYDPAKVSNWLALATQVALLAGAMVAYLHKRPLLLIGLVFFYIAFLPSSRIIGEPGMLPSLSDRILYLPSVGFTIMLAFGLKLLAQKLSLNAAAITVLIVTAVLTPLTWARNTQWANDILLFESDYRKLDNKDNILPTLLAALLRENNNDRAVEICDENRQAILAGKSMGAHCGSAYGQAGRLRDAEQAYLSARNSPANVFAHFNLAMMYVQLGRRTEAEEHVALAIAAEKMAFLREYFKAVALIQLHPSDRNSLLAAHAHLEQALKLQPQHVESHKELDLLNQRLNEVPPAR